MLLIIGANGRIGRLVVAELLAGGISPRVFVRDAAKAAGNFGGSVEVTLGDLDDRASIDTAMAGVDGVFICCPVNPNQVTQQNAVVDAAKREGSRVVKLSGLATFPGSFVDSGRWHAETEAYLADSGLPYTCLHPYFFMQNLGFQLADVKEKGVLKSAVATASIAMVDARDIAAVVARLLREPDLANGETLPLTCDESMTYEQIADTMTKVLGRPVRFEAQSMEEVERNLRKSGQPDWHVDILLQFNRAFDRGYGADPHPAVRNILGRAPLTLIDYLEDADTPTGDSDPFPS